MQEMISIEEFVTAFFVILYSSDPLSPQNF